MPRQSKRKSGPRNLIREAKSATSRRAARRARRRVRRDEPRKERSRILDSRDLSEIRERFRFEPPGCALREARVTPRARTVGSGRARRRTRDTRRARRRRRRRSRAPRARRRTPPRSSRTAGLRTERERRRRRATRSFSFRRRFVDVSGGSYRAGRARLERPEVRPEVRLRRDSFCVVARLFHPSPTPKRRAPRRARATPPPRRGASRGAAGSGRSRRSRRRESRLER